MMLLVGKHAGERAPMSSADRIKLTVVWLVAAPFFVLGFGIIGVGTWSSLSRAHALDSGDVTTIEVSLEGEPGGRRSGWTWRAYPVEGGELVDEFKVPRLDDSTVRDGSDGPVSVDVIDGEVGAVHLSDGTVVRTSDVGVRGAVRSGALGGLIVSLVLVATGWLAGKIRDQGDFWQILGFVGGTLTGLLYIASLLWP